MHLFQVHRYIYIFSHKNDIFLFFVIALSIEIRYDFLENRRNR